MYPNLYYLVKDVFGFELSGLKLINSFGFFVALAFLAAAWALTKELKRKKEQGLFTYGEEERLVGEPATTTELVINFLLGFIMGFKIIGGLISGNAFDDPQSFIFSSKGNWITGILLGALFVWLKWQEKNKQKLATPVKKRFQVWPHERVGDMVIYAAIFGFLGAKVFDILESPASFFESLRRSDGDIASVLFSGLTFYGGLICAGVAITWYAKKNNITIIHLADAFAPAMMLAYAVGRVGCQVAGDGDWGIINMRPNPGFLPDWAWAYTYPHNVIEAGVPMKDCVGHYCNQLAHPVFPTPLYELVASFILFLILWSLRKKLKVPGQMAGIYLIFNGTERFLIEKIRVNATYDIFGLKITQAEIISSLLIIAGIVLWVNAKKWFGKYATPVQQPNN